MSSPGFVHLRLHSEYSIADGTLRIDDAVAAAAADRMPALALTDLANQFGLIKFYTAARARGIKPIAGCDVWIANDSERDQPSRLLVLAATRDGYLRLCNWLTEAYRAHQHRGRPQFPRAWFDEGTDGLIALSGARDGDVGQALVQGNDTAAARLAREWMTRFPQRYVLEVQRAGHGDDEPLVQATAALADRVGAPLVATHPIQFLSQRDFRAHEARVCIAEGHTLADARRPRRFSSEQYFPTQAQMAERFADLPQALSNAVAIAQRCNLTIPLGRNHLPRFPTPAGVSLDDHLRNEAARGLDVRLQQLFADAGERERRVPQYRERLDFETKTIVQMGFSGYFLIVADFINWAKRNGVPVGPGRGSGAGSLVAYSLGITDLDPLRYALLFERFLNPERVSMPDFDIDFCQDGRDRVIDYVKQKYGAESVSQIATFGTLAAKAAVRDVGRVLDLPYSFVDGIAQLIPFQPGKTVTLRRRSGEAEANVIYARDVEPMLDQREEDEEEVRELLALACELEGLPRNVGMHAGGVLIAPGKLTDFCPLYVQPGAHALVSQFDKDDVEAVGLVKFDFLGLTTLTILDWTLRYVHQLDPQSTLTLETLPLDDGPAFDIFRKGNTTAVFQFESRGMRELIKQAPPTRFEDIIALVALYRPGPMELIPDYTARKSGRERVEYLDPRLAPILEPTCGVMVYQEQVMQIAQVIGGYTLGAADLLRRAMGKKKPEEMAKHRDSFVAGAEKNGLSRAKAVLLFDLMEKFAGYGFNKSHSAAYALIAYQTAYFKAHHGAAFMAANLSLVMDDTDKVKTFYDDAIAQGLAVLPPDVNGSRYRFEPVDARSIRYRRGGDPGDRRRPRRGRPLYRSLRFLPPCRQENRQPSRRRGTRPRRLLRRDRSASRVAVRVRRARARRRRARRRSGIAGLAVRGGTRSADRRDGRRARLDGGRAADAGEARARLLSVRPSVRRLCRRARAGRSHVARHAAAEERARARRRHRDHAARAGEPPRQDGVRHARRRQGTRRGARLQRDFRRVARAVARGPARHHGDPRDAARHRGRRGAGAARHCRERVRSRVDPQALCERHPHRLQRQRVRRAARRDTAAVSSRRDAHHRPLCERAPRRRARAARGVARESRRRADRAAARVARARERAGRLLTVGRSLP